MFRLILKVVVAISFAVAHAAVADTCTECLQKCEETVAIPCAEEFWEPEELMGCVLSRQSCRARCTCPAPETVKACSAQAKNLATSRDHACRVQFPANPTGCLDKVKEVLSKALASCARS